MTNLQAIQIQFPNLSETELRNRLILVGVDPDAEYNATNRNFWYTVYLTVESGLNQGVTRISEGGYTIEMDKDSLLAWYNRLANQWGFPKDETFGVIVNQTNKW